MTDTPPWKKNAPVLKTPGRFILADLAGHDAELLDKFSPRKVPLKVAIGDFERLSELLYAEACRSAIDAELKVVVELGFVPDADELPRLRDRDHQSISESFSA